MIRYYFVKQHVDSGMIKIKHCPTEVMCGDYFTKPTQGSLFHTQCDVIMNIDLSSPYHWSHRSVLVSGEREHAERAFSAPREEELTGLLK